MGAKTSTLILRPSHPRAGAKRSQTSPSAPVQCPQKSQRVPNPSIHSAAANRTHRALLSERSESKGPTPNTPKRPKPRQTTPPNHLCKTKPPANSTVAPAVHSWSPMLHSSQQLPVAPLEPSRRFLPEPVQSSPHQLSHSSCRAKPSGFPVFRWVQYSPLHLRKSVSNGF
jgi:hypothetical protein